MSSSDIHIAYREQGEDVSLVTVKRILSEMVKNGLLNIAGREPVHGLFDIRPGSRLF